MKARVCCERIVGFVLVAIVALTLCQLPGRVSAQKSEKTKTSHAPSASTGSEKSGAPRSRGPAVPINAEYSAKIKEYTTQSYFNTELVDYLPASDKVTSPDKVLGYPVGAPGHLTYTKDLYRYYHELEKATPRVRTFVAPEKSEEGKEQLLIAVGDEATLARLDRYKEITAKLADPRKLTDDDAEQLIGEGKVFY